MNFHKVNTPWNQHPGQETMTNRQGANLKQKVSEFGEGWLEALAGSYCVGFLELGGGRRVECSAFLVTESLVFYHSAKLVTL